MKDSFDKDPFAEYDKYWDDLDKQEEQVKKKSTKNYAFHDVEKPTARQQSSSGKKAGISLGIMGIGLAFTVAYVFVDSNDVIFSPIMGIIFFGIVISMINKNKNK